MTATVVHTVHVVMRHELQGGETGPAAAYWEAAHAQRDIKQRTEQAGGFTTFSAEAFNTLTPSDELFVVISHDLAGGHSLYDVAWSASAAQQACDRACSHAGDWTSFTVESVPVQ